MIAVVSAKVNALLERITLGGMAPSLALLVVSDPDTVASLSRALRKSPIAVRRAEDFSQASAATAAGQCVVFLDMRTEGAWDWLRENQSKVPVVVLVDDESVGMKALLRGADAVINIRTAKPPELIGVVARVAKRMLEAGGDAPSAVCRTAYRLLQSVERAAEAYSAGR